MISEIQIIVESSSKGKANQEKGSSFERMIRHVLECQQYKIVPNVNFTGLEIDLFAEHETDNNSNLYVECKAKGKVNSDDLKRFAYAVFTKKPNKAYFIHTTELDHQVAGLKIQDFDNGANFNNVTFYSPDIVISLLSKQKKIRRPDTDAISSEITKEFLIFSEKGDYFAYMANSTSLAFPDELYIFDAKNGINVNDNKIAKFIQDKVQELSSLLFRNIFNKVTHTTSTQTATETVVEISQSDSWLDYKPASDKDFVGRKKIKADIMQFFKSVEKNESKKRLFYLTGKSGMGKSSLINSIKANCFNKQNKNKFYALSVDSINAETNHFVGLAFQFLIKKAIADNFIDEKKLINMKISFVSYFDLLSNNSVKKILEYLKLNNKYLILIFDQFEDVFRREHLYQPFHEFLLHINNEQANIILGFSWKNEIMLSPSSGSYKFWNQAKGLGIPFEIEGFNNEEIKLIIQQLENEPKIGKLSNVLKNILIDNSEGYPWRIKKLCIHIYNEVVKGKQKISQLSKANLNINNLFKKDMEGLTAIEENVLLTIAKSAENGSFFHENDFSEVIPEEIIRSLADKRLIVKTGQNYKPYWDNFREYLLGKSISTLTTNYTLRLYPNICLKIFLLFEVGIKYSISELCDKVNVEKKSRSSHIINVLIDLQKMDLIEKDELSNYSLPAGVRPTEEIFISISKQRIKDSKIYSELIKSSEPILSSKKIADIYRTSFDFTDKNNDTWDSYSKVLIQWIYYLDLDLKNRIIKVEKGRGGRIGLSDSKENSFITNNPENIINILKDILEKGIMQDIKKYPSPIIKDLRILDYLEMENGILIFPKDKIIYLRELMNQNEIDFKKEIVKSALSISKIKTATEIYRSNPKIKAKLLYEHYQDLFGKTINKSSGPTYATKLKSWAEFILNSENNFIEIIKSKPDKEQKKIKIAVEKRLQISMSTWEINYQKLTKYFEKYRNSDIDSRYGPLGTWVATQRRVKDTLTPEQIERLNILDYNWTPIDRKKENSDAAWKRQYQNLKKYFDLNGNFDLKARDGSLGTWIVAQRQGKEKLSNEQKEKLNQIDFPWDPRMKEWESNFKKWLDYLKKHPNRPILSQDKEFPKLGLWVDKQRKLKRANKLENKRYLKLKETPFPFNPIKLWIESYNELKIFKELNGHIELPQGKEYKQLRGWLSQQRNRIKNNTLDINKIKLLKELGVF